MTYQVLARKWRPRTFTDVVGQEHVLIALTNSLASGRMHHAYLFSGTHGVGKTSIARLLAKGLNCETGITTTPCGVCDNCRKSAQGHFVDLIEIDAASRTKVEDIRDLLDNVQYAPTCGRFKVYLIDEVHMLSRHSFNALLKTLEEPPSHVKFLLATTNPKKLPITILSRCLQFYLKALDVDQICEQLEHILTEEKINFEFQALQLLARAAEGSLRDALNLTDQAIASGERGQVTTKRVSAMLGTLDDTQVLSLIEALVAADGERVMTTLTQIAALRGNAWEELLVAMQNLLHRIAIIQLLPSAPLNSDMATTIVSRMRELARTLPPTDVQLYYQILVIGRKELPYAPNQRMGVEMTLLRALTFHPGKYFSAEPEEEHNIPVALAANDALQDGVVSQMLAARKHVQHNTQRAPNIKESKLIALSRARTLNNTSLKKVTLLTGQSAAHLSSSALQQEYQQEKKEAYSRRKTTTILEGVEAKMPNPKALKKGRQHEETLKLTAKLAVEAVERDSWTAQVSQLNLPKLAKQMALNAWKEQDGALVRLHLRPAARHLNTIDTRTALAEALAELTGSAVELTIVQDDNPAVLTPLEWRQAIYDEKLAKARETIIADNNIQTLRQFFDADLDEDSICPIR